VFDFGESTVIGAFLAVGKGRKRLGLLGEFAARSPSASSAAVSSDSLAAMSSSLVMRITDHYTDQYR